MEREFLLGCLQARIEDRNIKHAETIKHLGSEAAKLKHAKSQLCQLEAQLRTAQAEKQRMYNEKQRALNESVDLKLELEVSLRISTLNCQQLSTFNSQTDNNTKLAGCIVGRSAVLKCLQSLP